MNDQTPLFTNRDYRFLTDGAVGKLELMTRGCKNDLAELDDWLVVICHPHPQHGGTMDNKVVTTVARASREAGLDSLRFNYRGVGASEGDYGEFSGECDDFDAVMKWVSENTSKTRIVLAGFSFGSAVAAKRASSLEGLEHLFLLAPPVERYDYPSVFSVPTTIVQGSADEVVDSKGVTDWAQDIETAYEYVLMGHCSHFFHGRLVELRQRLILVLNELVAQQAS